MSVPRLTAAAALLACAAACNHSPSSPSPPPGAGGGGPVATVIIPEGAATLGDRAYNPDPVEVAAGTIVLWVNGDVETHTSTSNGAGWDSGPLPPNGHFLLLLQKPGTYHYHCAIHPGMVGTIIVH